MASSGPRCAQLQSFAQTLSTECEDQTPEPPSANRAAPAAPDEREEDTNYPLMAALFRDDQKRRAKGPKRARRVEQGRRSETTRVGARWLRDVYASGPCVRSDAFAAFLLRETAADATKSAIVAARARRLLAEADALTAQKTRDELERLRAREAEVAGATGGFEVKASRCEQALSALVARRDALSFLREESRRLRERAHGSPGVAGSDAPSACAMNWRPPRPRRYSQRQS